MKNWEKYEKEIKEIGIHRFAVLKGTNKVARCQIINCKDCLFNNTNNLIGNCYQPRTEWLYSDYEEPAVLTDDERILCKLLNRGWLARDKDNGLFYYQTKPFKDVVGEFWLVEDSDGSLKINITFPQCKFNFIKWEDEEPWKIII